MSTTYYDTLSLQKVNGQYVQLRMEVVDAQSETSRTAFRKTFSVSLFIFLLILLGALLLLLLPILFPLMLWVSLHRIFGEIREPSYEESKEWFKQGKGYFANLSEEEKRKITSKKDNLPLGL
ncbi:MAG: hypothetical protein GY862_17185 [Gammaproteobacteria bacterium]|nr:hypothetical protein [Gammaproteobacteria bacterium]